MALYGRKRVFCWTAAALLALSTAVSAGWTNHFETNVELDTRLALGSLYGARMSDDNIQYIGCMLSMHSGVAKVTCTALDADSEYLNCSSTDPKLVEIAQRISGHGYILFRCDEADQLIYLAAANSSQYLP